MSVNSQIDESVKQLCTWYGDGCDDLSPKADQWLQILKRPPEKPITLINFFKFRPIAEYPQEDRLRSNISGQDAFSHYSSVSIPTMEQVGGQFLLVAPYEGMFLGQEEDWDLIAIGTYPNIKSFMGLHTDLDYRTAYRHRKAACERQKVILCSG
ncbi:DUF1330 domain-containing protein [Acaryochloris marina NIES-2412]|uniref:DUF1330 domain-containing protein n=1 Tax=Acaryochloris marina TaxID=155978 RepID=UPI0040599C80